MPVLSPLTVSRTYFVTGAQGCIGSWVVRLILEQGDRAVLFDLDHHDKRLAQVLSPEQLAAVDRVQGDVTDTAVVRQAIEACQADAIIHLAGLQVPFCAADPVLGARVNVVGTLNMFEAARAIGLPRLVYASSAAVYDQAEGLEQVDESVTPAPATHYGVYKLANEGNARVYWQDAGLASVGLRPLTVYGLGRDQGLTSGPTRALKAASLGRAFTIGFSGPTDFLYVADAARAFVECATAPLDGARIFNLHGESVDVAAAVALMDEVLPEPQRGLIQVDGPGLPIAPRLSDAALRAALPDLPSTSLREGFGATLQHFQELASAGRLPTDDLDS